MKTLTAALAAMLLFGTSAIAAPAAPDEEAQLAVQQDTMMAARCEAIGVTVTRLDRITALHLQAVGAQLAEVNPEGGAKVTELATLFAAQAKSADDYRQAMATSFLKLVVPHAKLSGFDPAALVQQEQLLVGKITAALATEIDAALGTADAGTILTGTASAIAACTKWQKSLAVSL